MIPSEVPGAQSGVSRGLGRQVILLCSLLWLALGCHPRSQPMDNGDGPDSLIRDWVAMWNSYDLDQVEELFLNDPDLTYFSSEKEGVIRGFDAVLEHHRGFGFVPGGEDKTSRLWLESSMTDLFGETAVVTALWFFQSDETSPADPQKGPVTFVCIRNRMGWRFVHMNFSEYAPPESP